MLECVVCGSRFERKGSRGPIPKYCSPECGREPHKERKRAYDQNRTLTPVQAFRKMLYGFRYNQRPEVKEKQRRRMQERWWNDPEYRAKQLERFKTQERKRAPQVAIPAPFTGHMWLDKVRNMVAPHIDGSTIWADDYYDDMGEGVLALLEGRDPKEAITVYRKSEFISRRFTIRIGDRHSEEGDESNWFDYYMPSTPSAEDEYISAAFDWNERGYRFDNVATKSRRMKHKTGTPSNRRSNNR